MRALIVEGMELPVDVKHADHHTVDGKHAGFALGDVADFADRVKVWHGVDYLNCQFLKSTWSVAIHVIMGCRCTVCSSEAVTHHTE